MKTYESILMGRYLISLANKNGTPLNMTKLQKLMFIIYGYYLTTGHSIVNESPKAWPFGPVFPRVHKKVDYTKADPLDHLDFKEINEDRKLVETLENVVSTYAPYSATQLSNWSHMEGSPWDFTTKQAGFKWNSVIPDAYISSYFSKNRVVEQS